MGQYDTYPQIWAPPRSQALFVVRVPQSLQALDEPTYRELMQQRGIWMIQQWMQEMESDQEDVQAFLSQMLQRLDSTQRIPPIQQDNDLEYALVQWQEAWATLLIHDNWRFKHLLPEAMGNQPFPVQPLLPNQPNYQDLLDLHQETSLESWLINLLP
ncbi:hypothetical protein [Nodosilinea nodulosa]|uniref:hypothetical protein n=1 Tax=Nodosilinea nodulosa TaxID=416001 RepID=UPI00031C8A36|nr:hypothetical protein [Nodosilinea nodulosa]